MLTDPQAIEYIDETFRVLNKPLQDISLTQKIPVELTAALEQNTFIFSGFKTDKALTEVSQLLIGKDGGFKPFKDFLNDVQKIDQVYNKNYLNAEYNLAVQSVQMALKWKEFVKDGDNYDLQYRTAFDEKVREEHRPLHAITLPVSDPFWRKYFPPNGWGCRCTVVQVRKGKYAVSNPEEAMKAGDAATEKPKQQIFRFNPGAEEKIFPKKHPYFPKNCGDCDLTNIKLIFDSERAICRACKKLDKAIVKWSRDRIREHYKKLLKNNETWNINNKYLKQLTISHKDIETISGKPHDYPYARNLSVFYLKQIAERAKYLGWSDDIKQSYPQHKDITAWKYYEFDLLGSKSILIVKEFKDGTCRPHHIQDSNHFNYEKIKYPHK
jgi:SPP1 gp7 family putative phage head morphogenesis protein